MNKKPNPAPVRVRNPVCRSGCCRMSAERKRGIQIPPPGKFGRHALVRNNFRQVSHTDANIQIGYAGFRSRRPRFGVRFCRSVLFLPPRRIRLSCRPSFGARSRRPGLFRLFSLQRRSPPHPGSAGTYFRRSCLYMLKNGLYVLSSYCLC